MEFAGFGTVTNIPVGVARRATRRNRFSRGSGLGIRDSGLGTRDSYKYSRRGRCPHRPACRCTDGHCRAGGRGRTRRLPVGIVRASSKINRSKQNLPGGGVGGDGDVDCPVGQPSGHFALRASCRRKPIPGQSRNRGMPIPRRGRTPVRPAGTDIFHNKKRQPRPIPFFILLPASAAPRSARCR